MEHVLNISPDGTVKCLWNEALPLNELGQLQVERASQVEFNPATQQWEVRLAGNQSGQPDFTSASRESCIQWEISTLNATL